MSDDAACRRTADAILNGRGRSSDFCWLSVSVAQHYWGTYSSNQDLISCLRIWVYMGFWVHRGFWILSPPVDSYFGLLNAGWERVNERSLSMMYVAGVSTRQTWCGCCCCHTFLFFFSVLVVPLSSVQQRVLLLFSKYVFLAPFAFRLISECLLFHLFHVFFSFFLFCWSTGGLVELWYPPR